MSDQDLKYDLASKYAEDFRTASRDDAYGSYIDGWDAARDHYGAAFNESQHQLQEACRQREDLRAEVERLKAELATSNQSWDSWQKLSFKKETEINELQAEVAMQKATADLFYNESNRHAETIMDLAELITNLRAENKMYREEMDKMQQGIPSEWAYSILLKERDQLHSQLKWLVKHSIETGVITKAKGAELLDIPLIDLIAELEEEAAND